MNLKPLGQVAELGTTLSKWVMSYFNKTAYENRVLTGLVKTGDGLAACLDLILKNNNNKRTTKYAKHYVKKWKADRDNLT